MHPIPESSTGASPNPEAPEVRERARINQTWLLRLRWGVLAGQALLVLVIDRLMGIALPLGPLAAVLTLAAASNAVLRVGLRRGWADGYGATAAAMAIDAVLLTAFLALSGGSFNPFTTLYLVNVALGAILLPRRLAWGALALSLGAFASLFLLQDVVLLTALHVPNHAAMMDLHLRGMWVAFAVAAGFIVYFVQRVTGALARREQELALAQARRQRDEKLASLATLAAGAAHELSTPLSTITVVVRELERSVPADESAGELRGDLRLIREQVERCREILQQMSAHAGQNTGEPLQRFPVDALVSLALTGLPGADRVQLERVDAGEAMIEGPQRGLARALRGVLKNALQASPVDTVVTLRLSVAAGQVRMEIRDRGPGLTAEQLARVGEPFFTTKSPGEGMGLGLFLARSLLENLGGALHISNAADGGARVILELPRAGAEAEVVAS